MKIDLTKTKDVYGAYNSIDYKDIKKKYKDEATKYAFDVLDKKVIAGYKIQLACFRHLQDLKRQGNKDFPYVYNENKVRSIINFASICPDAETRNPVTLAPFQCFILAELNGWRTMDGEKRFDRAILSMGRHNGKTYLMAVQTCYDYLVGTIDKKNGKIKDTQQFLLTAENADLSSNLLRYVKRTLRLLFTQQGGPFENYNMDIGIDLKNLETKGREIIMKGHDNLIKQITYNSGSYDGYHFTTAIADEFGSEKVVDRKKIESITTGQTVESPQFIQISTAYGNPFVPFHEEEKSVTQAMEQDYDRKMDTMLLLCWEQDNLNETEKPETWIKSNPLLEYSKNISGKILNDRDKAKSTGNIKGFQNKNLNVWLTQRTDTFLELKDVQNMQVKNKFDIHGRQVYIGFDYSITGDNTAIAFCYPYRDNDGKEQWYMEQMSFIPWKGYGNIQTKSDADGIDYENEADNGNCIITSDLTGMINDDQIYDWLINYIHDNELKVMFFGFDPARLRPFINTMLANTDYNLESVGQNSKTLASTTENLKRMVEKGNIHCKKDDNIMTKALTNATVFKSNYGFIPDKTAGTLKIDVVDAMVTAFYDGENHFNRENNDRNVKADMARINKDEATDRLTERLKNFGVL